MRLVFRMLSSRWLCVVVATFVTLVVCAHVLSPALARWLCADAVVAGDRAAWEYGRAHSGPTVLAMMRSVSDMHGSVGILLLTAAAAWAWRLHGRLDACVRLLFAVPAGMLLNVLVKMAFHRVRPDWAVVELPRSYSFPSGHSAQATVLYGTLALEATVRKMRRLRLALALLAVAMVALVATSRIVLGVHFLSDCIGGVVEGLLWSAACVHRSPLRVERLPGSGR
ncbi:MAG: phosphatase PAP2 family protein [Vitreoscilla sp.]